MSIKIKISIIAICFALVAAVCVGFAFAAPNEKLNLKGTLSYEVAKATISVSPNISTLGGTSGSGSTTGLSPGTGSGEYVIGETVTLTATPSGSTFLAWATSTDPETMKIVSTSATYSFELTEDSPRTYYALFNQTTTEQTVGDLEYTIYEDAELASVTDTTSTELSSAKILPEVQSGENSYKVYSIGNYAFRDCSGLTSVSLPSTLTSIGNYAFFGCSKLTSISIPEGVTSIGYYAFSGCSSLITITLPGTLTSIGNYAFFGCSSLTTITLPGTLPSIGNYAFFGCSSLTTITLPGTLTSIGNYAFSGCSSLTSITIPEGVTSIGDWAFQSCSNLTSISIPEGVTSIGSSAFSGCSSLEAFNGEGNSYYKIVDNGRALLVDGGKTLLAYAPANTATSYTIPEGVTSIDSSAFRDCSRLTSLTLGEGVTSLPDNLFGTYYLSNLTEIVVEEGSTLSAALPTYGTWVKDGGDTVTSFSGAGTYTRTDI